jgi:tetratricopeptide (TPR) repeat protein
MAASYDDQELLGMLSELEQFDTADWVSSALLELALEQLLTAQESQSVVGWALGQLMRAELWYHRQVREAVESEVIDLQGLARLARRHQEALEHNAEDLGQALVTSRATRVAQQLGLAECRLRLGELAQALVHLKAAQDAGVNDPLLYLVTGHTQYQMAAQDFAQAQGRNEEDQIRFQLACLRAVSTFEQGLGGHMDAQLYWWIGAVLETAGFAEAAGEAFQKARAAQHELEDDDELEDLRAEPPGSAASDTALPEIDAKEERLVDELLRRPDGLQKLLGPDTDTSFQ